MHVFKPKNSSFWHYEFEVDRRRYRRSSKQSKKHAAIAAMTAHRNEVISGRNLTPLTTRPKNFAEGAKGFLEIKKGTYHRMNVAHLLPVFGSKLVTEITPMDVRNYQDAQLRKNYAPASVNHDVATLRGILRRNHAWERIRMDIHFLPVSDDFGVAITHEQESRLLAVCERCVRSRGLFTFVLVLLCTGMRFSELRYTRWKQIDFIARVLTVGIKSKTKHGRNRRVLLNNRATRALLEWASKFPERQPDHFVFFTEMSAEPKKGTAEPRFFAQNPLKPMGSYKTAWSRVRKLAGVNCRMHDLRHTAATRMLKKTKDLQLVARLLGWSPSTMYLMARKYQHLLDDDFHVAVSALDDTPTESAA